MHDVENEDEPRRAEHVDEEGQRARDLAGVASRHRYHVVLSTALKGRLLGSARSDVGRRGTSGRTRRWRAPVRVPTGGRISPDREVAYRRVDAQANAESPDLADAGWRGPGPPPAQAACTLTLLVDVLGHVAPPRSRRRARPRPSVLEIPFSFSCNVGVLGPVLVRRAATRTALALAVGHGRQARSSS